MNTLHILTIPENGKFLLVGDRDQAEDFTSNYDGAKLDSEEFYFDHCLMVDWLVENGVKKVIHL